MAATEAMDGLFARLEDATVDTKKKATAICDLRDNLDQWIHTGHFSHFLTKFMPLLLKLLDGQPSFTSTSPVQVMRNGILEIFHRFPQNQAEALRPYAPQIIDKIIALFKSENEDNAVVIIKIFLDFQRSQAQVLGDRIGQFLNLVADLFENIGKVVKETFSSAGQANGQPANAIQPGALSPESSRSGSPAVTAPDAGPEHQPARVLAKSMQSFKVLTECPITVVSIFQQHKQLLAENLKRFVPLVKALLLLQAPLQELAHAEAKAQGAIFVGVAKNIKQRAAYGEFITAQVKTMSFLAYILRSNGPLLQDFTSTLPEVVIRLLKDCPKEKCGTRKELLVAIRHIVNFNFRKIFISSLDDLLDERILLGEGLGAAETQRGLAFSLLADLIHHLRDGLSDGQIRLAVKVYTRNLADTGPGTSFQTMSAKLLLNLADKIAKMEDKQEGRLHLINILDAIGDKFAYMNRTYKNAKKISEQADHHSLENVSTQDLFASKDRPPDWDEIDVFSISPIKAVNTRDRGIDPLFDNKFLFRNLVQGLKNIFYQLRACNPPVPSGDANVPPAMWKDVAFGFDAEEVNVLIKLVHEGIGVFQYYPSPKIPTDGSASILELLGSYFNVDSKEEKELLETFATVFHNVDPAVFHEVFGSEVPYLYERMFENPCLLQIPQFLLASEATSPAFAGVLLEFLMQRIDKVGSSNIAEATILLRLFKLSFMAVTLFSHQNEVVLLPHIHKLITKSFDLATTAECPMHYFYLLRSLFRSIGGGKFEHLYKEILPLLEMLLEKLNNLIHCSRQTADRDLFVELSLTVPARLSHLLPHLSYLMKPLVLALRAGSELVGQGLRTLELCVDNLTAEYLDPIMAPVIHDLMAALWSHLQPSPYSMFHAHTTMRILGKLGGRNRRFLDGPPTLDFQTYVERQSTMDIQFTGSAAEHGLSSALGNSLAINKLEEIPRRAEQKANDAYLKQQALDLLIAQIKMTVRFEELPDEFGQIVRLQADDLSNGLFTRNAPLDWPAERHNTVAKRAAQRDQLKNSLRAIMYATSIPHLTNQANTFLSGIYKHFAVLEVGRALLDHQEEGRRFNVDSGEGPWYVDHRAILDAIVESLASERPAVRETAEAAILSLRDGVGTIFGAQSKCLKVPLFSLLLSSCCHSCHGEEWFTKAGGSLGIKILANAFGADLISVRQLDICRALIYAAKDLQDVVPKSVRSNALETLMDVIRISNAKATREDVLRKDTKINHLCTFLMLELSSMSQPVRETAQKAFSMIAEMTSMEMHEIVAPMKDNLFRHVFTKPLRSVAEQIQVGYIEAVAFCFKLGESVLKQKENVGRFLNETITLANQDEDAIQLGKINDERHAQNVIKLKVACLHLLSLALDVMDDQDSPGTRGKPRIISVFFKSLYSKHDAIVDAGNEALKVVVAKDSKLPKDILQNGLRPILVSLGEPQNLRMQHMQTLARLLLLLKSYFKVEIGSRLLENIFNVADSETLQKASFLHIEQHERIKVLAAVFNVFHLLPDAAKDFMTTLVARALELEKSLRRTHFSPLRQPVMKYLTRYPQEAWEQLFSQKVDDRTHSRLFAQILAIEESKSLRLVVSGEPRKLFEAISTDQINAGNWITIINGINIIDGLCIDDEIMEKMFKSGNLTISLLAVGRAIKERQNASGFEADLRLAIQQAGEQILRMLARHVKQVPEDLDCLFALIKGFATNNLEDIPSVSQDCIYETVLKTSNVDHWNEVTKRCLELYASKDASEALKASLLRMFITPMLAVDIMRNWDTFSDGAPRSAYITSQLVQSFAERIFKPQAAINAADEDTPPGTETTRMEVLQMTTLLMKYCKECAKPTSTNREIVRFLFVYIKVEDVLNKYAAYVALAYYIASYDLPPKFALSIYAQLVRTHASEARVLVTQALEVIAPVLRAKTGGYENNPQPWITWARRPILEDPSLLVQTQAILTFVARHPDLFYEARDSFTITIMAVLPRIAPLPAGSLDSKKAILSLMTLIWKWQSKFASEALKNSSNPDGRKAIPYSSSMSTRMMILKYLATFITLLTDRYPVLREKMRDHALTQGTHAVQAMDVCIASLEVFQSLISAPHWSDVDISSLLVKMEPTLGADLKTDEKSDAKLTAVTNTLQLLRVIVNAKPDDWIVMQLPQLRKLLEKLLRNSSRDIQECLHSTCGTEEGPHNKPLVLRIIEAVPQETNEDEMDESEGPTTPDFIAHLTSIAVDTLNNNNALAGINIFNAIAATKPRKMDDHFNALGKAMNTTVKDYCSMVAQQQAAASGGRNADPAHQIQDQMIDLLVDNLIKMIELLGNQIGHLGDHRRPFLSLLTTLVERSASKRLCFKILELTTTWVFAHDQPFPNVKEKSAVITKMLAFMKRGEPEFSERYLDLIARIYEDPKVTRSELAIRLESSFLVGTCSEDVAMRSRFMNIFDRHLSRSANKRFLYLLTAQEWKDVDEKFWLSQVIELLFGSIESGNTARLSKGDFPTLGYSQAFSNYAEDERISSVMMDDDLETFIAAHRGFCGQLRNVRIRNVFQPLCQLQHADPDLARQIWREMFPLYWSILVKEERLEMQNGLINLMSKEYHQTSMDRRPNCIQVLMEGIVATPKPRVNFPPHLTKYLSKTFNAWYSGMCYMEENAFNPLVDTAAARESNLDALAETYSLLEENDMFYGLWRRRCDFLDTLTALSFEQHGDWAKAQRMYDAATIKARTGASPFKQGEYILWEDHFVRCAQKLQQWDILSDFAKADNLNDLFLDAIWRQIDYWHSGKDNQKQLDNIVKMVSDAPTPRRAFFQSFMALLKAHQQNDPESSLAFTRANDEAIQLSIRKWHQYPKRITNAHVPVLQSFQQLCELYDASVICQTISNTTRENLDQKAPELKLQLNTWRDRLPNFWDDINAWQELVTWRQHIFSLINKKYLTLMPTQQGNVTGNSLAFRGYHETASIINRFAHVARKHDLPEVCITQLSKIYTLPNIEIQEAFLKLREQAKCHYHNPDDLNIGLDVINNTNLNYFGPNQKAEFYTLKGMFLAKQEDSTAANDAFGSALYFDLRLPKAWAEWARYNDQLFKENPGDMSKAAAAVSCYLEAASVYKNAKTRKFLSRILWLLSLDDSSGSLAKTFDDFKGEITTWYWITFIPQLLISLSKQEGKVTNNILGKLARTYPQALFFSLRTSREDFGIIKRQIESREAKAKADERLRQQNQQGSPSAPQGSPNSRGTASATRADSSSRPGTATGDRSTPQVNGTSSGQDVTPKPEPGTEQGSPNGIKQEQPDQHKSPSQHQDSSDQPQQAKRPWEYIEDIFSMLKTAFPLLALSLETMVDQINKNMKLSPDEDAYRLITALHNDACAYVSKSPNSYSREAAVPASTEANVVRFAESVLTPQPHLRRVFEQEFTIEKPPLLDYIAKLRKWRDKFEEKLDRRMQITKLEACGPLLSEFKFQKFDEVEVPGQYLLHKDNNKDFIRIDRFMPDVDLTRGPQIPGRRLWIRGHDGSAHPFAIQHPTSRPARRDERMLQAVRFFNDVLAKRKESRRRNLQFTAPTIIPLTPNMRMVRDDPSYITLQTFYDDYCRRTNTPKDEAVLFTITKLREMRPASSEEVQNIRIQGFEAIQSTLVPKTLLLDSFRSTHRDFPDFWLLRRQFAYQLATLNFLTYIFSMRDRVPYRMSISRSTGNIWGTDLIPGFVVGQPPRPIFGTNEQVPFRLTPNLQMFLGPIALEGIFAPAVLVIAKALIEPSAGVKLEQMLSLFVRDEVLFWHTSTSAHAAAQHQQGHSRAPSRGEQPASGATGAAPERHTDGSGQHTVSAAELRQQVSQNVDKVVKKVLGLAFVVDKDASIPINQSVLDLVAKATDPALLAAMDVGWMPWL